MKAQWSHAPVCLQQDCVRVERAGPTRTVSINMPQLIVNADDMGLSEGVNEGIVHAHVNGMVTSTSLMANGAAFNHAVELLRTVPSLDVGIHLTLVEEKPILGAELVPSLLGEDENLHAHATIFFRKYMLGQVDLRQIRKELEAQIQKVVSHGIKISHIDSHQHLHMLPAVFSIIVNLAKTYGIPCIRIPAEFLCRYMFQDPGKFPRVGQLVVLKWLKQLCGKGNLQHCDYFTGFFYGGRLDRANLLAVLQNLPKEGTCELMCHPGEEDSGKGYEHWGYKKEEELAALTDPWILDWISKNCITLITFPELAQKGAV